MSASTYNDSWWTSAVYLFTPSKAKCNSETWSLICFNFTKCSKMLDGNTLQRLWGEDKDNKLKHSLKSGILRPCLVFRSGLCYFCPNHLQAVHFTQNSDCFHPHGAHKIQLLWKAVWLNTQKRGTYYLNQIYCLKVNMYRAAQTSSNTDVDEINDKKWNIQTGLNLPEWGGALSETVGLQ